MTSSQLADIQYDFVLRPMLILAAHDEWILSALTEAALIEVSIVGGGHACILLRLTRLQFCGKLIYQRPYRLESRVGIGILRIEIRGDARVPAVAQPCRCVHRRTL